MRAICRAGMCWSRRAYRRGRPGLAAPAGAAQIDASRDDRRAGTGGHPLAPVEHAAARHVGGGAGPGYFRVWRGLGPRSAPATLPGHARGLHGGDQLRHHHGARLVPQCPQPSPCRRRASRRSPQAGLRARFSYGCAAGQPNDQPWTFTSCGGSTRSGTAGPLGACCRSAWPAAAWAAATPHTQVPAEVYRKEIAAARDLGIPVTVHACGPRRPRARSRHWRMTACWGLTCR